MFGFRKKINKIKPYKSGCFYYRKGEGIWNYLTEEKLAYIVEESRMYLENVLESRNRLIQKELFLLALIIGLLGFTYNEFISQISYFKEHPFLESLLIGYFVLLLFYFFALARHQLPSLDYAVGQPPKNLLALNDENIKDMMKYDYERIIVRQLEIRQDSINQNEERNNQIAKDVKVYFWLTIITTIVIGAIFTFCYYRDVPVSC